MVKQMKWNYEDFSHEALVKRANYLLNQIDKIEDKATYEDISNLPKGRIMITWGPSSGKTTAIRQYLCRNQMNYIIYATARKSDVDSMYYDLMAMKAVGVIVPECKIAKFHSNYDPGESDLRSSNILLCTHERLTIEPPSILYRLEGDIPNHLGKVVRSDMIIDELPKFYKSFKITEMIMTSLGYVNSELDKFLFDREQRLSYRYAKFRSMIEAYLSGNKSKLNPGEYGAVQGLIKSYQSSNIVIKGNTPERAIRKFAYFSDLLAEKLLELTTEQPDFSSVIDKNLYYSLLDIDVPNIKIFDGTGDLIIRGSNQWKVIRDSRFQRNLYLDMTPQVLDDTTMIRNISGSEDLCYTRDKLDNLINHIRNILSNKDSRLLLYTWKSIRLQYDYYDDESESDAEFTEDLPELIRSKLSSDENDRLEITYYGSGKERVTSEFSECNSILIAGKFFIPNSAIVNYNEVNDTKITSLDYTKSLIIQAIYRTSLRHGKSIKLYFTSDYSGEIIQSILSEFDEIVINNQSYTGYYRFTKSVTHNNRNKKYYDFISPYFNKIYTEGEVILEVPKGNSGSFTRDFKLSISKLVSNTDISYENIFGTNKFKLIYKKG